MSLYENQMYSTLAMSVTSQEFNTQSVGQEGIDLLYEMKSIVWASSSGSTYMCARLASRIPMVLDRMPTQTKKMYACTIRLSGSSMLSWSI